LTALEIMLMVVPTNNRQDSFSSFVADAENAFSRQHEGAQMVTAGPQSEDDFGKSCQ
jgi:hypothetical protein